MEIYCTNEKCRKLATETKEFITGKCSWCGAELEEENEFETFEGMGMDRDWDD
jgi:hypothetical protein